MDETRGMAAIVRGRGVSREFGELQMACTSDEKPRLLGGGGHEGAWAGNARFSGKAVELDRSGQPVGNPEEFALQGSFYAVASSSRLGLIISPDSAGEPALWWAFPLAEQRVEVEASSGLLKKRPSSLLIRAGEAQLAVADVAKVFERSNRFQTGQAADFLNALGGSE